MSYEAGVSLFGFHLARQIASGEPPVLYQALTGRMCQWRRGISSPEVAQEDLVIGAGTALARSAVGVIGPSRCTKPSRVGCASGEEVLVAPKWPRRTWLSALAQLLHGQPWELSARRDLLSQGHATRGLDFWYCDSALFLDGRLPTDPGMNCQTIQYGAHCSCYTAPSQVGREIVD
ncbi:UNVERIFIED_CONTAM: hypothetical protein FKN15_032007 [Acipenser sinensis]